MNNHAKVSVVMPAYNAEKYIGTAIASVVDQTIDDWELIVVDDCSTDGTYGIVVEMAKKDPRIKCYRNEKNLGVAKTRNFGLDVCTGEYVALLDSDDVWYKDKMQRQLELLRSSNADIAFCSYAIVDEFGNKKCADFIVPSKTTYEQSLIQSVISCSTVVLSREIVNKYRFSDNFYHEDLVLWLQLLKDGYVALGATDVLAEYRVFSGGRSFNKVKSMINKFKVYRGFLKLSIWTSSILILKSTISGMVKYKKPTLEIRWQGGKSDQP